MKIDLGASARSLAKTPRLTGMALACLVVGLGATLSVLTLINALLIRPPPFPEADRLVRVWATIRGVSPRYDLSYLDYLDIRRQASSFEHFEGIARTRLTPRLDGVTVRLRGEGVSSGYFDLIDVRPATGRLFTPDEYQPAAPRVMLISDHLWTTSFGRDPEILERVLTARSVWDKPDATPVPYTIIGVMPPGFVGTIEEDESHFWIPLTHYVPRHFMDERGTDILWTLGRLKPGVSFETAAREVETIGQRLLAGYPDRPGSPNGGSPDGDSPDSDAADPQFGLWAQPFGESWRAELRRGLHLLLAASGLLLLITCTNVANLLLARLAKMEHELCLRRILGADQRRILRQLVRESLLLATLGGAGGLLLAAWGTRIAVTTLAYEVPSYIDLSPDGRVVVMAVLAILITGTGFGVLPAWLGSQLELSSRLRETGRGASGGRRQATFGRSLVIAEIALTFVLLVAAGLILRSYADLRSFDYGYRTDHLLRMSVTLNRGEHTTPADWRVFMRKVEKAVASYPGVRQAAVVCGTLPPWKPPARDLIWTASGETFEKVRRHRITAAYLPTMDIQLLHGRNIRHDDDETGTPVALLSQSLARTLAGDDGRGALGQELRVESGSEAGTYQVVGMVEDVRFAPEGARATKYGVRGELGEGRHFYLSGLQATGYVLSLAIHTEVEAASLIEPLRKLLGSLAPTSPVHWISTMDDEVALGYSDTRLYAFLVSFYTLCAVLLAGLGIYGVLANDVARRIGELGLRMAIGASRRDILRLVVGRSLRTVGVGIVVGAALAFALLGLTSGLLPGLTGDPATFLLVALGLALLGVVACLGPALRAVRLEPAIALREE